jgi:RimJ/RimL family protein N-acetyltransferase
MKALIDKLKFNRIRALVYQSEPDGSPDPVPYELRILTSREKAGDPRVDRKRFHKAYVLVDRSRVIHGSLVFTKNRLARQLGFRGVLIIGNCFTDEGYRGQGLYPAVLKRIRADFPNRTFVVFVDPANTPSIRGLEKAGFRKLYEFEMYRLLAVCLYKRKLPPGV